MRRLKNAERKPTRWELEDERGAAMVELVYCRGVRKPPMPKPKFIKAVVCFCALTEIRDASRRRVVVSSADE